MRLMRNRVSWRLRKKEREFCWVETPHNLKITRPCTVRYLGRIMIKICSFKHWIVLRLKWMQNISSQFHSVHQILLILWMQLKLKRIRFCLSQQKLANLMNLRLFRRSRRVVVCHLNYFRFVWFVLSTSTYLNTKKSFSRSANV